MVEDKVIEKYSTTGRQIIVYLREVVHEKPIEIRYQLPAKNPPKDKTPNPKVRALVTVERAAAGEAKPIQLLVSKAEN